MPDYEITEPQKTFIAALRKKHHMSEAALDSYCRQRFHQPAAGLDRRQASDLIEEMKAWKGIPPEVLRSLGQKGMFDEQA